MRVMILGGAGMLGHKLAQRLAHDFEVWVTLRRDAKEFERYRLVDPGRIVPNLDVEDWPSVREAFRRVRPDAVINCVGIIKQLPAAHDPIPSITINSLLPHRLHRLCGDIGARLLHFSSDCVFNGRKAMYTEDDPSDALDLYGRTKFLGETSGPGALTIRSSIVGRELRTTSGLVEWFLSHRTGSIEGYTRAIYTGFTTQAMSRIVRDLLVDQPELHGTVQISSERITKFDLLGLLRDAYDTQVEIVPSDRVQIDRSLDSSRFRNLAGFVPPSWESMVRELAADPTPYDTWRKDGRR